MNKPDNQTLLISDVDPANTSVQLSSNGYNIHYTGRRTGVSLGGTYYANKISVSADGYQIQTGFRVDTSDVINVVNVGDIIKIGPTNYRVQRLVFPSIDKTTGKIVSFQNIASSPIEVYPQTVRSYKFDISINISDLPS